jgi:hypothetical protein
LVLGVVVLVVVAAVGGGAYGARTASVSAAQEPTFYSLSPQQQNAVIAQRPDDFTPRISIPAGSVLHIHTNVTDTSLPEPEEHDSYLRYDDNLRLLASRIQTLRRGKVVSTQSTSEGATYLGD